ncbi:MAG: sialidase, partial [Cyclobacteriaceae bacterium]|nr:sialidase [Cyclobacteriaceae bacterium]
MFVPFFPLTNYTKNHHGLLFSFFAIVLSLLIFSCEVAEKANVGEGNPLKDSIGKVLSPFFSPPPEYENDYGDYRSPLTFYEGTPVTTKEEWSLRRKEILDKWHEMMGSWPSPLEDLKVEYVDTVKRENIIQYKISFQWTPVERTTGYLLVPEGSKNSPAVVTVFYEPETAIGEGKPDRDFAIQLAQRGFVTLSVGSTETTNNETYATYYPGRDSATVEPLSMLAYAASSAWQLLA